MYSFANEVLNRIRTRPQALADLVNKYTEMEFRHPERSGLARMIARLQTEIALREAGAFDAPPHGACAETSFSR